MKKIEKMKNEKKSGKSLFAVLSSILALCLVVYFPSSG